MDGQSATTTSRGRSLSLILPAYNEEAGIRQAIVEADEALARLTGDYEILVVDDGSSDATARLVVEAVQERPRVRLLRHVTNQGYGAALRTGFEAARCDHVAFTDADCQFHLDDLSALTRLVERHEVVVGYRVDRQDPWRRRFFSWGYNVLVRRASGDRSARLRLRLEGVSHGRGQKLAAGNAGLLRQQRDAVARPATWLSRCRGRRAPPTAPSRRQQGLVARYSAHPGHTAALLVVTRAVPRFYPPT